MDDVLLRTEEYDVLLRIEGWRDVLCCVVLYCVVLSGDTVRRR